MSLHNEIAFETDICNHLAAQGWLYGEPGTEGDASGYDTPAPCTPPTCWPGCRPRSRKPGRL